MIKPSAAKPAFLALSCVGAIATASVAHAQEQKLGGVTVTDTAIDENPVKVEKAESPKYTAPLLDTPQTITVISKASIQQQNLLTLRDVLQTVPGITFGAGEGGFGYGDRIILRGQDAKNDVTIDGVRSSAFLNRNETYNIEQVEVTNGANSVYNGGGSVAGTINLVTKRPLAEDQSLISAGIGTDNYYRGTVDINKRVSDLIAVRLNAVYHKNDVPGRKVENFERWGVAPAITIGIDSPTNLTLQYEHLDDEAMPQYGLRYYAHLGGFLPEFDREGYYGFANLDRQNSLTNAFQAIFSHELGEGVKIRSLTRYENIRQDTVTSQPNGTFCLANGLQPSAIPTVIGTPIPAGTACTAAIQTAATGAATTLNIPAGYYLPTGGRGVNRLIENDTAYTQLDLSAEFDTGGLHHSLVVGASALWEGFEQRQGNINRTAQGYDPYAAPFTSTTTNGVTTIAANPLYNAGASLGFYLPLVNIGDPAATITGPAATTGLARVYGSNNYVGPVNFILGSRNKGNRHAYAAYLFDTIKFGQMFEFNGGIRYEKAAGENRTQSYSTTPGATLGNPTTQTGPFVNSDSLFSYRVGLVFKPTPDISLYVAHGSSKNPSQASVDASCAADSCNLRPETTKNYEIGVKADLFNKGLLLTAALFRNDRDSVRVASGDPSIPDQQLDGRQRVQGVSLGASGNITENWTVSANYMYLDAKLLQGGSDRCFADPLATGCSATIILPGARLTNAPEHSGSLFTSYRFPFGLEVGYGLTYQGSFVLNQPTVTVPNTIIYKVPSYTIHRLMLGYTVTDNLKAQINVQNLTNEKYVTTVRNSVAGSWATPSQDRSAVFSLNYSF
ncbi:TonB-dependent receptor [Novosphingobium sp. JCM 18896]|uniref:TonB-dependent receptor n=1 Tax=Novosphingobium sp. JCM 18896 TaxID=2989731 RepID=UPI0022238B3C|nr:TonB-dependent receptor [Novosphingobium sp. JCM 18896]MCW1429884.1 TonB-dependent receptor [Novosphingobium sp. JCM 18896]